MQRGPARACRFAVLAVLALTLEHRWASVASAVNPSCDVRAAGASLQVVHNAVVGTANLCLSFHNDVYQRFSGYIVKHRVGILCERALSLLDGLQHLVVASAPRPGRPSLACGQGGSEAAGGDSDFVQQVGEAALRVATKFSVLAEELGRVLTDINAAGDGSLHAAVTEHLDGLAGSLLQLWEVAQLSPGQQPASTWRQAAEQLSDALLNLFRVTFEQIEEAVTYNVGALNVTDVPRLLVQLSSFPAAVPVEVRRGDVADAKGGVCRDVPTIYRTQHVFDPVADPAGWRSRDVSGLLSPRPSVQKLMFTIAKAVPLSYNLVAVAPRVQVGAQELTSEYKRMFEGTGGLSAPASAVLAAAGSAAEPACNKVGLAYSPPHCLFNLGWGSMMFSLSTEPPFDGVLSVSEVSQKGEGRPRPFVQPVANSTRSLDSLMDLVDGVYKSLNTPSPDLLFISPMVGNCLTLRRFGPSRRDLGESQQGGGPPPQLTPKLVWVPVNPLVAPPWEFAPNFTQWHERWLGGQQDEAGGSSEWQGEAAWWYAQCSLASAVAVLAEQGYALLHMEHSFAVFILKGLWPAVAPLFEALGQQPAPLPGSAGAPSLYDHWLRGWFCSPVAPTLFGLEWAAGADLAKLHDRQLSGDVQREALCAFARAQGLPMAPGGAAAACGGGATAPEAEAATVAGRPAGRVPQSWRGRELRDPLEERGKAYLLEAGGRGRCLPRLGFCECFPPYRGRFCEDEEPGRHDASRAYRAVLHYLVGDRERLLNDFVRTLPLLWERFNERFDYPVVVFHDGLASSSRQRILEASKNRVWFAFVDDYASVPAFLEGRMDLDLGGYSVGYRGMCRFRSGPMFTQPVMSKFDYSWTLDTDGYFPAEIRTDPFERMWREGRVYGYSHISRDQASAVQHFWEFCRLYIESKGLDPKGTPIMRRITDALVLRDTFWHEWNRVLFMNDIEITQLAWFRGEQYQDFFRFLDSVGGFWLYRWGDHAVRTIAIALFLDQRLLMRMGVPYGHQNTCRCGEEHPDEVCVRSTPMDWWRCVPRSSLSSADGAGAVASGDVGTVDERLLFGDA